MIEKVNKFKPIPKNMVKLGGRGKVPEKLPQTNRARQKQQ